jgi:hypothetical protein
MFLLTLESRGVSPLFAVGYRGEEDGRRELLQGDKDKRVHAAVHGHLHQQHHDRRHHVEEKHHGHGQAIAKQTHSLR